MRDRSIPHIGLALLFMVLTLICGYGLLSSFEPGNSMLWRIGYGFGALTFLSLAIRFGKGS